MGINVMIWPPSSPDLNPIENLWALLKPKIYEIYPELEHAADTRATLPLFTRAGQHTWEEIDKRVLLNLSMTMPHQVQAIRIADGWYTKY